MLVLAEASLQTEGALIAEAVSICISIARPQKKWLL